MQPAEAVLGQAHGQERPVESCGCRETSPRKGSDKRTPYQLWQRLRSPGAWCVSRRPNPALPPRAGIATAAGSPRSTNLEVFSREAMGGSGATHQLHPGTPETRLAGGWRTANRGTRRGKGDLYKGRFVTSPSQARVSAPEDVREDQLGRRRSHLPPGWNNEGEPTPAGGAVRGTSPASLGGPGPRNARHGLLPGRRFPQREQWLGQKEARRFRPARSPGADDEQARDTASARVPQGSRAWRPEDRGPRTGTGARPISQVPSRGKTQGPGAQRKRAAPAVPF